MKQKKSTGIIPATNEIRPENLIVWKGAIKTVVNRRLELEVINNRMAKEKEMIIKDALRALYDEKLFAIESIYKRIKGGKKNEREFTEKAYQLFHTLRARATRMEFNKHISKYR